ncbi:MAG: hypothetical protein HOI49_01325 [Bacteroidetes bacterium]|nr:hypothetical protein [Bacteroidota bacterium]MDA8930093.1 hypothetical protein [Bacteroidia bacterium]
MYYKQKTNKEELKKYISTATNTVFKKIFFPSGKLKAVCMYTRGIENGRKIEYYDCGSKKLNANYIDGVIDGIYEEWDHVGRLIVRKTYFKGRVFAVKYL